jgi:outer membrane protein
MKFNTLLLTLALCLGLAGGLQAQDLKIGYASVDLVLAYMPETQTMNQQLASFEKKLGEQLQIKQQYLQEKYSEYLEFEKTTSDEAVLKTRQDDLIKLEEEVQAAQGESRQKLMKKRQELLAPIVEKMQKALDELAGEESYDYILNSVDGQGVSVVLHGPEEHDLTRKLMKKLGIEIPEEVEAEVTENQ